MEEKFDVDPYALADEVSVLLGQEEKKPEAIRMSFKQLTAHVYRGHNIRGEEWYRYNKKIGKILRARPRKNGRVASAGATKETSPSTGATREISFGSSFKKAEVVHDGKKYVVYSYFAATNDAVIVEIIRGGELLFIRVAGKIKHYGSHDALGRRKKADKRLLALGMKIAKTRFAERDKRQGDLDFA